MNITRRTSTRRAARTLSQAALRAIVGLLSVALLTLAPAAPATAQVTGPPWLPVVDMDNGVAVIGNPAADLAHIVANDGSGWSEIQTLTGTPGSSFGAGVAIDGDRLYVGAPEANGGVGELSAFRRGSDGLFAAGNTVTFSGATAADDFGTVLDVGGPWVIAGAPVPGASGAAVIYDLDLNAEAAVLTTAAAADDFGSAVAVSRRADRVYQGDGTAPGQQLAWVGAPSALDPGGEVTGQVYAWVWDGAAWVQVGFGAVDLQAGDRRGAALAASSRSVLASTPGRGFTGLMREESWNESGLLSGRDTWTTPSLADGDLGYNQHLYAVGSPSDSAIHLLSDNDNGRTPSLFATFLSSATGRSLAIDGDWLIGATDAASADWTQLAVIAQVSSLGTQPATPDNKTTAPFGTAYNRFGQVIDATSDTWVAVSPSWQIGNAPNSVHVYDSASGAMVQRIVDGAVGVAITDVALDGNRMATVTAEGVTIRERAGGGAPYDVELGSLMITGARSVDLNGDLLAVGRPDTNEVLPFQYDGSVWQALPALSTTVTEANDGVGYDVAVSGDVIVAGAPVTAFRNRDGYAAVWSRTDAASAFTEQPRVVSAPLAVIRDKFGASVDFDGEWLAVGSPEELIPAISNGTSPGNPGAVSMFRHLGGGQFDTGTLLYPKDEIDGGHGNAAWGHSVELLDDWLAVGGPGFVPPIGFDGYYAGGVAAYQLVAETGHWSLSTFLEGQRHPGDPQRWDYLGMDVGLTTVGGLPTVVGGAPGSDSSGADAGAVYTYTAVEEVLAPLDDKLVSEPDTDPTDAEGGDLFGWATDTDGTRLVVGVPESPIVGTGGVYVFTRGVDGWDYEQFVTNPDATAVASGFGSAVAVDGNRLVVGAPTDPPFESGTAWVIDLATGGTTELPSPDEATFGAASFYGTTVDVDGSIVAIGAPGYNFTTPGNDNENQAGKVYVWEDDVTAWSQTFAMGSFNEFTLVGQSVSLDGDVLAIGAPSDLFGGSVEVWRRTAPGSWTIDPVVNAVGSASSFGWSVDLDGDHLIVGAPEAGEATLYTWDTMGWSGQLLPDATPSVGTNYGWSVSLEGTVAVVGEPDAPTDSTGVVHTFGNTAVGAWTPLGEFTAGHGEAGDQLGWSVDVTVDGAVFGGAPYDHNLNGADAGAVYVFGVTPPPPPGPVGDPVVVTAVDYTLPATATPGATSVTLDGADVAATTGDATTSGGIVAASVGEIDLDAEVDGQPIPLGDVTLGDLGIDATLAAETLARVPLSEFPVDGGWAQYLPDTHDGVPLQTITLGEVWNLATVQSIPLRFAEIEASPLRFADIAIIGFGGVDVLDIDLDGDPATAPLTEWCDALVDAGSSCADVGLDAGSTLTLGTLSATGVNLEATPLRFAPLRFAYVEASPLRFAPLRFADIEASPLRFAPLRFADIEASPLRFAPLRFAPLRFAPLRFAPLRFAPLRFADINATPLRFAPLRFATNPGAVADCTIVDCTDPTLTLGDVADAGALRDDFTFNDLGDTLLGDLRIDDIVAGLTADTLAALQAIIDADDSITLESLLVEFGIDGIGDMTLGDLDPEAFEVVAALSEYTVGEFLATLPPEVLDDYTIADFLLLFVPRESYDWDAIDLADVALQLAGSEAPLTASVSFTTTDGPATSDVTIDIDLPAGAVAAGDTFTVTPETASITGIDLGDGTAPDGTVRVELTNVAPDIGHTVTFGLWQGLELGTSLSSVTVTAGTSAGSAVGTLSVVEAFEPGNDTVAGAVPVLADNLYISHVGTAGDQDFYRLTVTQPATTVSVELGNLGADYDLVVYGPRLGSIIPTDGSTAASAPDADFDASGSGTTLSPVPLNDLPTSVDDLQVYGASYFRGTDAEQVDFLALEPGDFYVQVTGYLGASSSEPYSLRAAATPTVELPCPARTFEFGAGSAGTNSSVPSSANTLILLNRSRLAGLHGADAAQSVVDAVQELVLAVNVDGDDGIEAAVLDLDAFGAVQNAYQTWDASPCSTVAVNNVVGEIANAVLGIRSGQQIEHVLIVGGDDVVPFGRVADATTIANEQSYTNTFTGAEDNALRSAFAGSWVLTDDPYADRAPTAIANTDRVVYVPELSLGRLVESPDEIVGALDQYVRFAGVLDPQTGFVAGYDFLDDGAAETGDNLAEDLSATAVRRLINETWTSDDLLAELATNPDQALVAAHFDHANALPAAGNLSGDTSDLFDVTDAAALDFSGSVLFSVGCHGGLSVSDLLIAPTGVVSTDWAQTFLAGGAAAFVGNTGYGYGDDTAVALSEKLMADFAAGLGDYETVGEALLYAKQQYASDLTVYGAFDEKALMEATLYGIPFYRLPNTVVSDPVPDVPTVVAPSGSVVYTDSFDPILVVDGDGTEDEIWSTPDDDGDDQIQVTNGYPILPRYEWEVTQQDPTDPQALELEARGVVLESLVTRDEINVDPATARAVYDLAANEPNVDATDVTFALAPAITTYLTPEGARQNVSMTVGAFQSTEPDGSGTMRLFEAFDATVYYADDPSAEAVSPVITDVQANPAGGVLNLAVEATDASAIVRVVALVSPTPLPGVETTWQLVDLSAAGGALWQGSTPLSGDAFQWLVMVVDEHGNTGWSMSKQLAFDGENDGATAPILINPDAPETPVLAGGAVDLSVELWDFDGSDDAVTVIWDFGDGTSCATDTGGTCLLDAPTDADPFGATSAAHSYAAPGVYTVTVTATDATGLADTIALGPVVVTTETTTGWTVANGQSRSIGVDDILPPGSGAKPFKVNVTAGYTDEVADFEVRLTANPSFDFRGTSFDYVDVIGDVAVVVGSGLLAPDTADEVPVRYRVTVDDAADTVVFEIWPDGASMDTAPLYRVTTELTKRSAIKVRPD